MDKKHISKNPFVSLIPLLSVLMFGSLFVDITPGHSKSSQDSLDSQPHGILCGDIFAERKALKGNFQQCRYKLDQFDQVRSNLQTIEKQLNDCPTSECFLLWGEILSHVRGEILGNLTLTERSFDLPKDVRMKWEQEWRKVDKEESRVRREAYNKGFQRQRSTHESDYLTLD